MRISDWSSDVCSSDLHRDLWHPDYCDLAFYGSVDELSRWHSEIASADAVIVGSYVPDGIAVGRLAQQWAGGVTAFYDIDRSEERRGRKAWVITCRPRWWTEH